MSTWDRIAVIAAPTTPEPEPDPRWEQTGPDLIDALNGDTHA